MAKGTRKCKVCGVEYEYCHTVRGVDLFRWQDVACCPEHGSIYFAKVLESRKAKQVSDTTACDSVSDFSDLVENEEDELFEEDFYEDEDE